MREDYYKLLNQCSQLMILEDSCSLASINRSNDVSALSFIPFAALHCREAGEYLNKSFIDKRCEKELYDLRNVLKFTDNPYGKIARRFTTIDQQQDRAFKPNLLQRFFNGEEYYNLGIYFDGNGDILFDTYSAILFMGVKEKYTQKQIKRRAFNTGKAIGNSIKEICKYYNKKIAVAQKKKEHFRIGYQDVNTHNNTVFNPELDLKQNLLILHLLSIIGADKYLLSNYYTINSSWIYRQHIICAIAVKNGLEALYKKMNGCGKDPLKNSELIKKYVDVGRALFPTAVRNSMMHYGLVDKDGNPLIDPEKFNPNTPFFGLIEYNTGFNDIEQYFKRTFEYLNMVQVILRSFFKIDINNTMWDL